MSACAELQASHILSSDSKQEWDIRNIIGKEVVDGEIHYLVEWSAIWWISSRQRLLAQCRHMGRKRQGRLPPTKAGKQEVDLGSMCETIRSLTSPVT
jgi:hypothetical protein